MLWMINQPKEIADAPLDEATLEALHVGLKGAIDLMVADAKRAVARGPKTGRIYMKGKNKSIRHQASAPGEPPATDTGRLLNSIVGDAKVVGKQVQGYLDARTAYAGYLEFGTRRMAARPFMTPAVMKNRDRAIALMRDAVQRKAAGFRTK
jgi:HK97 gp10 family phage protein